MILSSKSSETVQADAKLGDISIRHDTFICNDVYDENVCFSMLYSHSPIEISVIVSGNGVHKVLGQAIPCKAGDMYIINSNVPHRYFAADENTSLTFRRLLFEPNDWFSGEVTSKTSPHFCYGLFSESPIISYALLTQKVSEKILSSFDAISLEILEKKSEWRNVVSSYLSLIMISHRRYVDKAIKNILLKDSDVWNPISAVIAMVKENYGDPNMSLEQIAQSLYISKSYLSRLFKQITSEAFSDYLKKTRLAGACDLLENTNLTVEEVMKRCGMRDSSSFYKLFGNHTGLTPNQYRKNIIIKEKPL